jgi:hypothetical protein
MNMHHYWAINGRGQKDFGRYVEDLLTGALSDDPCNEARTWVERYAPDVMTVEMRTKEGFKIQNVRTKYSRQTNTDITPVAPSTSGIRGPVDLPDRTHQIMSIAALLAESLQKQEVIISSLDLLVSGTTVPQDRADVESDATSLQILAEVVLIDSQAQGQGANQGGEVDVEMDSVNNDGNIQSTGSNAGAIGQWTPINDHVERMSQPSKETPAKPFVCEICNRSFEHRKYLQTRVREIHNTPAEPFTCEIWNRSYAVRRYLKSGIRRVHKSMPYECDDCGTIFSNEDHLLQHACEFHIEEMKAAQLNAFSLPSVELAALQAVCAHENEDLKSQEVEADMEMGDAPDKCESQEQTSTLLSQMDQSEIQATDMIGTSSDFGSANQQTPINSHVGNQPSSANSDKPFVCDLCDKRYLHERDMLYHRQEVHTHGKQFKYEECDKAYARQDRLNFHYRTVHLGERRFKCEDCGTAFC